MNIFIGIKIFLHLASYLMFEDTKIQLWTCIAIHVLEASDNQGRNKNIFSSCILYINGYQKYLSTTFTLHSLSTQLLQVTQKKPNNVD